MLQTIIALIIGLIALIYVGNKVIQQFRKAETDPKCDNCPVPDLMNKNLECK